MTNIPVGFGSKFVVTVMAGLVAAFITEWTRTGDIKSAFIYAIGGLAAIFDAGRSAQAMAESRNGYVDPLVEDVIPEEPTDTDRV